jgi:hypothetical protein
MLIAAAMLAFHAHADAYAARRCFRRHYFRCQPFIIALLRCYC